MLSVPQDNLLQYDHHIVNNVCIYPRNNPPLSSNTGVNHLVGFSQSAPKHIHSYKLIIGGEVLRRARTLETFGTQFFY